jgi:hypothetical protein
MLSAISVTGSRDAIPGSGISPAVDGGGTVTPGIGISPAKAEVASARFKTPTARKSRRYFMFFLLFQGWFLEPFEFTQDRGLYKVPCCLRAGGIIALMQLFQGSYHLTERPMLT